MQLQRKIRSYFLQPDPLMETLESVVGDRDSLDGRLETALADTEVFFFPPPIHLQWDILV